MAAILTNILSATTKFAHYILSLISKATSTISRTSRSAATKQKRRFKTILAHFFTSISTHTTRIVASTAAACIHKYRQAIAFIQSIDWMGDAFYLLKNACTVLMLFATLCTSMFFVNGSQLRLHYTDFLADLARFALSLTPLAIYLKIMLGAVCLLLLTSGFAQRHRVKVSALMCLFTFFTVLFMTKGVEMVAFFGMFSKFIQSFVPESVVKYLNGHFANDG